MAVGVAKEETEPVSENLANSYSLRLSDAETIAEGETEQPVSGLSDSIAIVEQLDFKAIVKSLSESLAIADGEGVDVVLSLSDSMGIAEEVVKNTALLKSESVSLAEATAKVFHHTLADSLTIAEQFAEEVAFERAFLEAISITDGLVHQRVRYLTDSLSIAESTVKGLIINKTESITLIEDMETDAHPQRRIAQTGFLRTIGQN